MKHYYFEDYTPGLKLESRPATVTGDEIIAFAQSFDPQPMHTDKAHPGGLIASGWHTASLSMRLFVEAMPPAPGSLGLGFDRLRWHRPVRPGDTLRLILTIEAVRESASRPDRGIVTHGFTMLNQDDEQVMTAVCSGFVVRRGGENKVI